ncbi:MAG: undecaprenyl-diphosphate phosphatase [Oscillospiraceae bacterium]|nr:undecaprenyl-diphosphate phosphatase [Oscillospiraceae bacterium]
MTVFEGILQGVIQGLTEFLPVSSDGHLSLFQHFFGLSGDNALFFTVMLHVGTLIAVFIAFWKDIWAMIVEFFKMIGDLFTKKFNYKTCNEPRKMVIMVILSLVPLLGFYLIKDWFTYLSEDSDIIVEGVCFLFTGSLLFLADKCVKGNKTAVDMTPREALRIGFFQGFAALPGVSRSGSTISVGLLSGFSREFMVKFSFIMGIPAILAASGVELLGALKAGVDIDMLPLAAGVVTAAVVGLAAIRLITWLVKTDRFGIFAYYTLILGVVVLILGAVEAFTGTGIADTVRALFHSSVR